MSMKHNGLRTEFLFDITGELERHDLGPTPVGHRWIVVVTGGRFEGPKLKGRVVPGGGDWLVERSDGVRALDVRITLRTDDEELIYMRYHGLMHGSPEIMQRLARGEDVDPNQYYFRTAPFFETASRRYSWLNQIIAIGVGRRTRSQVAYTVYAIL